MSNGTNGGDRKNGNGVLASKPAILVAIISSVLGATGGPFMLVRLAPDSLRPDPFTGTQGAALERRLTKLERHVEKHPDLTNRFDARITRLETQNTAILANQTRILDRLDAIR